jgi:hypothetical protein
LIPLKSQTCLRLGFLFINDVMIVNYTENGWEVITQCSHGLLAAQICAHWRKENQPERWMETLIATAEHDDVYNEFETEDLLTAAGGPKNYSLTKFQIDTASRLIEQAVSKSRFIALLMARHINFVHGNDPEGKKYCAELQKLEHLWLEEAKTTKNEVNSAYELLEFCDALSLLICQRMIPPEGRKIEISNGPDGRSYSLFSGSENELIVDAWPFEEPSFKMNYEYRIIDQLVFKTVDEFRDAIRNSPVVLTELTIKAANTSKLKAA